jgi:FKBP-type peptidyl-prolyl cis-trans isomerase SlyD
MSGIIQDGAVVVFHYELRAPDGEVLEASSGGPAMSYLHGAENILPGLEKGLEGHQAGDEFTVLVEAKDGYGERRGQGPHRVPLSAFPENADLKVGEPIVARGETGPDIPLWIVDITDDAILVDTNHPLAGVNLRFDIEILSIRTATPDEIEAGRPNLEVTN